MRQKRSVVTRLGGVEGNARLTALAGVLLFVLLAGEGVTILAIHRLLAVHLFIGLLLVPPLLLKMLSAGNRFARYYAGDRAFRAAGPPWLPLRLLAPVVVASTVAVFATGVELWLFGLRFGAVWLTAHKAGFVLWFAATAGHVLGHLERTPRLALSDLRRNPATPGALTRGSLLTGALILGFVLALSTLLWQTPFIAGAEG
jgi:hypothetical protein